MLVLANEVAQRVHDEHAPHTLARKSAKNARRRSRHEARKQLMPPPTPPYPPPAHFSSDESIWSDAPGSADDEAALPLAVPVPPPPPPPMHHGPILAERLPHTVTETETVTTTLTTEDDFTIRTAETSKSMKRKLEY